MGYIKCNIETWKLPVAFNQSWQWDHECLVTLVIVSVESKLLTAQKWSNWDWKTNFIKNGLNNGFESYTSLQLLSLDWGLGLNDEQFLDDPILVHIIGTR